MTFYSLICAVTAKTIVLIIWSLNNTILINNITIVLSTPRHLGADVASGKPFSNHSQYKSLAAASRQHRAFKELGSHYNRNLHLCQAEF